MISIYEQVPQRLLATTTVLLLHHTQCVLSACAAVLHVLTVYTAICAVLEVRGVFNQPLLGRTLEFNGPTNGLRIFCVTRLLIPLDCR